MSKLILILSLIFGDVVLAGTPTNIAGYGTLLQAQQVVAPLGSKKPIAVNLSGSDYTVTVPIRMITATSGTVIFVDMTTPDGKVSNVPIPPNLPVLNVTKIYKTGTDCANILIWPLEVK